MDDKLLADFFAEWAEASKRPVVTKITFGKYLNAEKSIRRIAPSLRMSAMSKSAYQELLNAYGKDHERTTCMDFHHILRACMLDALDDGVLGRDPSRKAVIRGKRSKKRKNVLSANELSKLMALLNGNTDDVTERWMLVLIARTGMRFAEALAITPGDFDFAHLKLSVNKTWNYKDGGGFMPTKNESSNRVIDIDWRTASEFERIVAGMDACSAMFPASGCSVYNSTYNNILARTCRKAGVPEIRVHGLRHTHASVLLASGVSIASISHRLGHSDINTTQSVYLHITDELAASDRKELMAAMCSI
ncbi:MAG: site-specific integrase [Raoultibacter sp.]